MGAWFRAGETEEKGNHPATPGNALHNWGEPVDVSGPPSFVSFGATVVASFGGMESTQRNPPAVD